MDHYNNEEPRSRQSGSFGRLSRAASSRRSFSISSELDEDDESARVSGAGDIGDRALHSKSYRAESGLIVPIQEDYLFHNSPPSALNDKPITSVELTIRSVEDKKDGKEVLGSLVYITCVLSLSVFGILGVLARYWLGKLFGPGEIGATSDQSYMYHDLPSNMVGSFLMGWLGVVFKGDISKVSDQLAIGLSTGFLGSLTTFSGWNQKMLDLSVEGRWVFAVLGILLGLFLVAYSIIFGIETAKAFKWVCRRLSIRSFCGITHKRVSCNSNTPHSLIAFMVVLLLILGLLWGMFATLEREKFETGSSEAQLFLACMVGPFGVWIRWVLARFNGRGLGTKSMLKWMPFGTLTANVLAACIMAALSILKRKVDSKNCNTVVSGIQLGFLGCLSTVSTFIAEFHAMRESVHPWRAYAYATTTIVLSFLLGTLIYSVPVWAMGL